MKKGLDREVRGLIGFIMLAFSSPCVIAMIYDVATQTGDVVGALMVGGFCTFGAILGIYLIVSAIRGQKTGPFVVTREVERDVLGIANGLGGRLTVSDLALRSNLTIDEAEIALGHFEQRDIARTHVSEDGHLIYVFPHFDGTVDKESAVDPLASEIELAGFAELEEAQPAADEAEVGSIEGSSRKR